MPKSTIEAAPTIHATDTIFVVVDENTDKDDDANNPFVPLAGVGLLVLRCGDKEDRPKLGENLSFKDGLR